MQLHRIIILCILFLQNLIKEVLKQLKTFKSEMREDRHRTESELQSTKEGLKQLKKKVDSQDSAIQKKDDEVSTVGDNKKLMLRFVARSFCSACVIVLAPFSHTVAPSRDRFNVRVIVFTKRNNQWAGL